VHEFVDPFLVVVVEIPEHGCVREVSLGMPFVSTVYGGKFDGVADEEDWLPFRL